MSASASARATPSPQPPVDAADAGDGRRRWERIVGLVMQAKPALGAVLQHGAPLTVTAERIVLGFPPGSFFGRQAEALDGQRAVADVAERVLGGRPRVEVVYSDDASSSAKTLAQEEHDRKKALVSATEKKALEHPLVIAVSQTFGVPRERMTVRVELE